MHDPVPIIITSYHRAKTFERCLQSIIGYTDHPIYIIDNSTGGLDKQLQWAKESPNVTIWNNTENVGKPTAIRQHWHKIPQSQWFITMDPDVIVPPGGIDILVHNTRKLCMDGYPIGITAPALFENDDWQTQLHNKTLTMHAFDVMRKISPNTHYNHGLAGCLLLVNTIFYNNIGGMPGTRLYNDDDGWLCNQSLQSGLLNIIDSNVLCEHDLSEESAGYRDWKDRNACQQKDTLGYWDKQ